MDMSDRMSTQGTSTMDVLRRKDAALIFLMIKSQLDLYILE